MTTMFEETPGWRFNVEEISMSVYRVRGSDEQGRNVERTGTDPDGLLEQCKADAMQIIEETKKGGKAR